MAVLIEDQIADDDLRPVALDTGTGAPQQTAQPQHDLLEGKRLGDVVVPTRGEPGNAVLHRILGGQQKDRQTRCLLTQFRQHLQPAHIGKHHVEHHGVGTQFAGGGHRRCAVAGRCDLPALIPQRHRHHLGQHGLVVDDENPDGAAVSPAHDDAVGCGGHGS